MGLGGGLGGEFGDFGFHVGGCDFPEFLGAGFFHEGFVVAVDDVERVAGPTGGFAFVFVVAASFLTGSCFE